MPTLAGRRLFFGSKADLIPGLQAVEQDGTLAFVEDQMRDDNAFNVVRELSTHSSFGLTSGNSVASSPRYLIFRSGAIPRARGIRQRRGGVKYVIDPTPDCLVLICGGLHVATGALVAGELQQPLAPS